MRVHQLKTKHGWTTKMQFTYIWPFDFKHFSLLLHCCCNVDGYSIRLLFSFSSSLSFLFFSCSFLLHANACRLGILHWHIAFRWTRIWLGQSINFGHFTFLSFHSLAACIRILSRLVCILHKLTFAQSLCACLKNKIPNQLTVFLFVIHFTCVSVCYCWTDHFRTRFWFKLQRLFWLFSTIHIIIILSFTLFCLKQERAALFGGTYLVCCCFCIDSFVSFFHWF